MLASGQCKNAESHPKFPGEIDTIHPYHVFSPALGTGVCFALSGDFTFTSHGVMLTFISVISFYNEHT